MAQECIKLPEETVVGAILADKNQRIGIFIAVGINETMAV